MSTLQSILLAICFMASTLFASPLEVKVLQEESATPNTPFFAAVHYKLEDGWHAYWKNPGDAGMAPTLEWTLPSGWSVEETLWPTPKRFTDEQTTTFGYDKEFTLLVKIIPGKTPAGEISLTSEWVVCSGENCLPGKSTASLSYDKNAKSLIENAKNTLPQNKGPIDFSVSGELITLKAESPIDFYPETGVDHTIAPMVKENEIILRAPQRTEIKGILVTKNSAHEVTIPLPKTSKEIGMADQPSASYDTEAPLSLLWILLFAFFGGLILNLMPCVLPVLSFKVMSFVKLAKESRSLIFKHGAAFSLGVVGSFWVLAGALLILKAWGHSVGWGFQLQEPIFVAALAALLFVFSLSLFGLFEFGTSIASAAGQQNKNKGLFGSFFSGVLATSVATPCTGPFLGTAVGAAVSLPWFQALSVFTTLGVGMASPYLLLAAFPQALRFVPKPGNWMILFKEIMGFLMLASTLWLLWVFAGQTSALALSTLLAAFLIFALACWVFGTFSTPLSKKWVKNTACISAMLIFCFGGAVLYKSTTFEEEIVTSSSDWEPFNPERFAELRKEGVPVFIDFTAKWCLTCQTNHMTLAASKVADRMNEKGVVKMKADWTKRDEIITKELEKYGRNSVPLYLYFENDAKPDILPQILTQEVVLRTLDAKSSLKIQ